MYRYSFQRIVSGVCLAASCASGHAADIFLQSVTVPGTAASGGPSFVIAVNWSPQDILRATVSGTVDFDRNNGNNYSADWNAAGVVVRTRSSRLTVGGTDPQFVNMGWLRLALGNDSIGYFPLLEVSAQNGLGSASPPETLTLNRSISSIFGASASSLTAGTTLIYRVFDNPTSDNSGAFVVTAVPEPQSWAMLALGIGALLKRGIGRRR